MKLDLSKGQLLRFAFNGTPTSGVVIESQKTPGLSATVTVETDARIPENAELTLPDHRAAGVCGIAHPVRDRGHVFVKLSIGYSLVDISTVGT